MCKKTYPLFVFLLYFPSLSDDSCEMSRSFSVHRRKTDLMPTIPSPRDCRSSLGSSTPRTPGSYQMTIDFCLRR